MNNWKNEKKKCFHPRSVSELALAPARFGDTCFSIALLCFHDEERIERSEMRATDQSKTQEIHDSQDVSRVKAAIIWWEEKWKNMIDDRVRRRREESGSVENVGIARHGL